MSSQRMRSLRELSDLSGRRALVVGAGHIGAAACEALAEQGASLAVCDIEIERARRCAGAAGGSAFRCDLANADSTRAAVDEAVAALGGLDILVHAAALVGTTQLKGWSVPFDEQTVEAWDAGIRVNLTSAFVLVQAARGSLSGSGRGSVILFGSIYGVVAPDFRIYEGTGMANPTAYGASKGGILQLVRYLAGELAPAVRVNAVSPGGVARGQPSAFQRRYGARTPLGRMASEEDIKGAVAYLASDLSAYVTGHNLVIDGGWTVW